ncbi:MAG: UDP-glucose 4-epimerase GalE [Christensenella sp.]|nr:UDP-glucose 4-epimerase GalE [Christensenella sp.]
MAGRILVTGGAGYIGSHTCVTLLEQGYDVVAVDNFSNSSPRALRRVEEITGKKLRFYESDLRSECALDEIFRQNEIYGVIHMAGLKAVGESAQIPLAYYDNNVSGTVTLLKSMKRHDVRRIIFSSSATVYGVQDTIAYTEEMPTGMPSSPYGRTKLMIEQILEDVYAADDTWSILLLRYFNPVGAHESGLIGENPNGIPNNLMPYITQVAVGRRDHLNIFGNDYATHDGTCERDYIHVMDLAEGHAAAIQKWKEDGLFIYNLGTGRPTSVLEVVEAFECASGIRIPYEFAPRREGDLPAYYADAKKAERQLGWKARYGMAEMCRDSWNWQKKNPKGYE